MNYDTDIESLLDRIRETIRGSLEGSIPLAQVKDEYRDLLARYRKLERGCQSPESRGFLRGLLHHHNRRNGARLTAIFPSDEVIVEPLAYAGDRMLMNALPGLISGAKQEIESGETLIAPLAGSDAAQSADTNRFNLVLRKISAGHEPIILAAVTSDPAFNQGEFDFLSDLIGLIFSKNHERCLPASLNYIRDISADITRVIQGGESTIFFIDQYQLLNPGKSFSYIGLYPMIEFSDYIVDTLKKSYPDEIVIYALSVTRYLVLYDEKTRAGIQSRRDRIDLTLHGNSIPYKVINREINGPQALFLFLEEL